ncbi:SWI/SNF-related matrix-associated actin-dependent regulator of chromatin subfamily A member 5 [Pycnococcus provasolii]
MVSIEDVPMTGGDDDDAAAGDAPAAQPAAPLVDDDEQHYLEDEADPTLEEDAPADDDEEEYATEDDDDDDDEAADPSAAKGKAKASSGDPLSPSKAEIAKQERARMRQQKALKEKELARIREEQNKTAASGEGKSSKARLKYLLQQTEIFSHFIKDSEKDKKAKKSKKKTGHRSDAADDDDGDVEADDEVVAATAHRLTVQPTCVTGKMREYQLQGLNWMIHLYDNGVNGILADEMGLGKTLQSISLLGYLHEYRGITGPHLIIVPKSTLSNWMNEVRRWCPVLRPIKFHGNAEERQYQKDHLMVPGQFDVCVTSFEMVIKEKNLFKKFHWRYLIIDEAHRIKNENSLLSKTVRLFHTNYRLLLTGTPLQNNLHELWALLNFLLPEVFANSDTFDEWFNMDRMQEDGKTADEAQLEVVAQLHKVLRPFLLRRIKAEVEKGLPPKTETILRIGMSEMQKKWYAALLQKNMDAVNGGVDRSRLLNVVMQLRKCCNHPYLFEGAEPGPPFTTDEHIVQNSGKMMLLDKLLPKLQKRGSRVLIFSQMTRLLDILEDYCLFKQYQYCRIDGNTSGDDREAGIDAFNAENSEKFIFLLSTRAGGLGINLATADIVVLYDSDWNPQVDLQAMDRAHRIGQKKEVHVYRFCIEDTVEEKVIEKAYQKLQLDALVIQQGRLTEQQASTKTMNKDELLNMVRYGAEKVFAQKDITEITDEDIDAIIAKGEEATRMLNEKMAKYQANARKFTLDGGINPYQYQDEDEQQAVPEELLKSAMAAAWVDPPRRERKKNYNESDMLRGITNSRSAPSKSGPKLPKRPHLHDFQFYNNARLSELYDKDERYITHRWTLEQRAASINRDAQAAAVPGDTQLEPMTADQLTSKDDPPKLTDKEIAEKEKLLAEGFSEWSKKDFQAFVKACERHGRADMPSIAAEIEGKEEKEVKAYSKAFWANVATLSDYDRIIKNIERGEQKIERQKHIVNTLAKKLGQYRNPWRELRVHYGQNRGKSYTEEEDRFLLCKVHQLGYGAWEELKAEVRKSWLFRFDWFLKSRTPQELGRRCDTLIRIVEKELEGDDEDARGGKRKVAAAEAGGAKRGKR